MHVLSSSSLLLLHKAGLAFMILISFPPTCLPAREREIVICRSFLLLLTSPTNSSISLLHSSSSLVHLPHLAFLPSRINGQTPHPQNQNSCDGITNSLSRSHPDQLVCSLTCQGVTQIRRWNYHACQPRH